jgi:selenocysteine lyase/cysteine desulfurase
MNLKQLGEICQHHNILYCVDAIQSLGALAFDVQQIMADFVVADGHKWLMSPEGLGLFYCRGELRKQISPSQYGWRMVADPLDFDSLSWSEAQTARKFECGSPNMLGIHALNSSIKLILKRDICFIEELILKNSQILIKKLQSISGIHIQSNTTIERLSGIVAFKHQEVASELLYNELMSHHVICAMRNGNIRFSAHYYTSEETLEQAIDVLKKLLKKQRLK